LNNEFATRQVFSFSLRATSSFLYNSPLGIEDDVRLLVRRIAIVVVILLGVAIVAASGSSSKSGSSTSPGVPGAGNGSHPATADVTITKCAISSNQFEGPTATLQVLNHSSKSSNYIIAVAFDSPDGKTQLDTGDAGVQNLASGQKTSTDASSLKSELRNQKFVCKIADVTRLSAVG
jgi:ABC-type oligopeptide transport system substrate-binding subunit